jgi:formate-nitrite transporter family protein
MSKLLIPVTPRDHVRGPANAPLTLVEYGDIQCAHCALVHPIVAEIAGELSDTLQVVFRHFPLSQVHPQAQQAAEALEAAGCQGRFWEMLDLLYQDNTSLDKDSLARCAKKARVDMKQFARELDGQVYKDRVRADFLSGVRSGVSGTPTFFINGEQYTGAYEFDALVAALLKASRRPAGS